MRKRAVKRYAGEDESLVKDDEMKRRGLEASKNERVGLFERLRMGNIDDPRSEAYKRFGAGRGLAESNKNVPIVERSRTEEKVDSGRGVSGFGSPVLDIRKEEPEEEPRRKFEDYIKPSEKEESKSVGAQSSAPEPVKKKTAPKKVSRPSKSSDAGSSAESSSYAPPIRKTPMSTAKEPPLARIGKAVMGTIERANTPYKSQFMKKKGGSIKMASGGKTSSASSRADGIATRGKTRGRIC